MKIFVDDILWEPKAHGREEVLEELMTECMAKNKVIMSTTLDGNEIDQEIFAASSGGLEARFTTGSVRELIKDTLEQAASYVPRLSKGVLSTADGIEGDKISDALATLGEVQEGLEWLINIIDRSAMLMGISGSCDDDIKIAIEKLLQNLGESANGASELMSEGKILPLALHLRESMEPCVSSFAPLIDKLLQRCEAQIQ